MLPAQVSFWNYQETKRHNLTLEGLEAEKNAIQKSNVEATWYSAREQGRHNVESESTNWFTAKEQQRHNVQSEGLSWFQANETQRHNLATEKETTRHNEQQENIGYVNAAANTKQAQAAMMRARVDKARYKLEKEMQPFKQLNMSADTNYRIQSANAAKAKKTYYKAQSYKTEVDIAQVPLRNKLEVWDRVNDSMSNITSILRGAATGVRSTKSSTSSKPGTLGSIKVKGGKTNVKSKKTTKSGTTKRKK